VTKLKKGRPNREQEKEKEEKRGGNGAVWKIQHGCSTNKHIYELHLTTIETLKYQSQPKSLKKKVT